MVTTMYKEELVVTYLTRLLNSGIKSVARSDVSSYTRMIGIDCSEAIDSLLRKKTLLSRTNGNVALNLVKLKKQKK